MHEFSGSLFLCLIFKFIFVLFVYIKLNFSLRFLCTQSYVHPHRKVRFEDSRKYGGILDDDNWLNPERREQEYQNLVNICRKLSVVMVHYENF